MLFSSLNSFTSPFAVSHRQKKRVRSLKLWESTSPPHKRYRRSLCGIVVLTMRFSFNECQIPGQCTASSIDPWLATARWREMRGTFLHYARSFPHALVQFLDKMSRYAVAAPSI